MRERENEGERKDRDIETDLECRYINQRERGRAKETDRRKR